MSRNPNAEMQVIFFRGCSCDRNPLENFEENVITGAPACQVQRVLPGVGSEGDVLSGAGEENPGEGFQEKSSQVSSRQGFYSLLQDFGTAEIQAG